MSERIAIIGGGKIGEALLAGLIGAGTPTKDLVVAERVESRAAEIAEEYGVLVTDVKSAAESAQYVFLAIKPDDVDSILRILASAEDNAESERVTVTLVAGLPLSRYESALQAGSPVIRVMPNTPMLVNEAMSAVSAGRYVGDEQLQAVVKILQTVGRVTVVPEKQMDAVTAVSGSGPAYVFLLAEAMIDAGVGLGLTRAQASEMAVQTIRGAGILLSDSGLSAVDLRAAVTSPGGTTAEAIREFVSYAYHYWRAPRLRYVLLLGDATYDFKDYLGTGVENQLPPLLVRTSYLWTASDPAFAAVHGTDVLPDLAIGRLPASSSSELSSMISKILDYERGAARRDGLFVLAADNADAPAFAVAPPGARLGFRGQPCLGGDFAIRIHDASGIHLPLHRRRFAAILADRDY